MNETDKAKIFDFIKQHAETLLANNVKDIANYSAGQIIIGQHNARSFLEAIHNAKAVLKIQNGKEARK